MQKQKKIYNILTSEEIEKLKEEEKRDPVVTENISEFTFNFRIY